eukprot:m.15743 g.15743  ORF g.15743 m.15743 type:complete len:789 (+) comp26519_c0_seq2:135-2501(+)
MADANEDLKECTLCAVTFNSPEQAVSHRKGQKHQKKLKAIGASSSSTTADSPLSLSQTSPYPKMCPVCPGVEFTSVTMEQSHCNGGKHQKKLKQKQSESKTNSDSDEVDEFFDAVDGSSASSSPSATSQLDDSDLNLDFCPICVKPFNHEDSAKAHYKGNEHKKKVETREFYDKLKAEGRESEIPFCEVCSITCNTMDQLSTHKTSPAHITMQGRTTEILKMNKPAKRRLYKVPVQDHPPIQKERLTPKPFNELVIREPRSYQTELYEKALESNAVIFLPTGMGKTLTSTLVVSHMLQENPTRQVIFVVDRKLLVFQQGDAFRNDLENVKIKTESGESRSVRIALVCGDRKKLDPSGDCHHLHEHDVIVVTAGSYRNLLQNEELLWRDVSLLVLDEAHHCVKNHPYRDILQTHYRPTPDCPKVLGLTASPAGGNSVPQTKANLIGLLKDMDSKLAKVTRSMEEYRKWKPTTKVECVLAPRTDDEQEMDGYLNEHGRECLKQLMAQTDLGSLMSINPDTMALDGAVQDELDKAFTVLSEERGMESVQRLMSHFLALCEVSVSLYSTGVGAAGKELEGMMTKEKRSALPGVPWEILERAAEIASTGSKVGSSPSKIVEELLKLPWDSRRQPDGSYKLYAMILVDRRLAAEQLEEYLKNDSKLAKLNIKTTRITGHGKSGAQGKGMSTKQQEETMGAVREGRYNVVVATSVAEEGVDLPECMLVIQTTLPRTLTSLVQIRGRARERGGRLVAICRSQVQQFKVANLLAQEKYMEEATDYVVKRQEEGKPLV